VVADTVLALTAPPARRIAAAFPDVEGPPMARNVAVACLAGLSLCVLSGCGTYCVTVNRAMAPDQPVDHLYGGVYADAVVARNGFRGETNPTSPYRGFAFRCIGGVVGVCAILDLPLSAVADTLTLPYVLYVKARQDAPAGALPKTPPVEQTKYADPPGKPVP
jgi:uncharacterized protein YceK